MANEITIAMMLNLVFPFINSNNIEMYYYINSDIRGYLPFIQTSIPKCKCKNKKNSVPAEPHSVIDRIAVVKSFVVLLNIALILWYVSVYIR